MLRVVFGPAARAEMLEAFDWYASRSPVVAARFIAAVDTAIARLGDNPLQFPSVLRDVRRVRLHLFPYALFFRSDGTTIDVIACFHARRNPRHWQRRT